MWTDSLITVDTRLRRVTDATSAKAALRREMRSMRRALPDRDAAIGPVVGPCLGRDRGSATPMSSWCSSRFRASRSRRPFIDWCRSCGKTVVLPEDDPPPDPATIDVVVVPGTAFTAAGDRLGQGGGWYDRFLPRTGSGCAWIGVGFEPQLVETLPVEEHDRQLHLVVTDAGIARPRS